MPGTVAAHAPITVALGSFVAPGAPLTSPPARNPSPPQLTGMPHGCVVSPSLPTHPPSHTRTPCPVFGLTSEVPDYAILIVSGVGGVQRMTREHFALAMALKLPTFIVVTKVDLCTPKQKDSVVATLKSIIKVPLGPVCPLGLSALPPLPPLPAPCSGSVPCFPSPLPRTPTHTHAHTCSLPAWSWSRRSSRQRRTWKT